MPSFNVEVPHHLGSDAAAARLKMLLAGIRAKYQDRVSDVEENWSGNTLQFSFRTFGFKIKGDATAAEDKVRVQGSLPIAAMAFRGQIEHSIRDELAKQLAKPAPRE